MPEPDGIKKSFTGAATAQDTAARLPALNLEAEKLCAALAGLHKKDKAGAGMDFHSFRPFVSGIDNPRKIDWKASARRLDSEGNEILLVRNREEERAQTLYLWCDRSASMDFRAPPALFAEQPPYTKKEAALILTLATAHLAAQAGESFALLGEGAHPGHSKAAMNALTLALGADGNPPGAAADKSFFTSGANSFPQGSHVFLFSDFLRPLPDIAAAINTLQRTGVKGHLVQILDPAEMEFRYGGHISLRGMEGENSLTIRKGESAKSAAEQAVRDHIRAIDHMVRTIPGWHYSLYTTNRPLHEALLPLYGIETARKPARPGTGARP